MKRRDFLKTASSVVPAACLMPAVICDADTEVKKPQTWDDVYIAQIGNADLVESLKLFDFDRIPSEEDLTLIELPIHAHRCLGEAILHPLSRLQNHGTFFRNKEWIVLRDVVVTVPTSALKGTWFENPVVDVTPFVEEHNTISSRLYAVGNALRHHGSCILYAKRDFDIKELNRLWTTITLSLVMPGVLWTKDRELSAL
jgi:hypothetical protein